MTPLHIEAVYERIPQRADDALVRWGLKASLESAAAGSEDAPPASREADGDPTHAAAPHAACALAGRRARPPIPFDHDHARRRSALLNGARERDETEEVVDPRLLGYGPGGAPLPLLSSGEGLAGRGIALNLVA